MRAKLRPAWPWFAFWLILSAGPASPVAAQVPAARRDFRPHIAAIRALIEKNLGAYERPGVSVALVDGDATAWSGSFGLADRQKRTPVTATTAFEMGSISKLFTCVAVMQLQEQGKVDLDRPLLSYVPELDVPSRFATGKEAITVRMLMTHHSGLVTDDDAWETTHPERYLYRALLPHLKSTPLLFPPGERFHYSSFGVHLLGLLVERVSGMDFADYLRRKVLGPLDMPHASFDARDLPAKQVAAAYHYNPAWERIPRDEIRPGGSLRAPVAEVAHLLSMVLAGGEYRGRRILRPESVAEMLRLQGDVNRYDGEALTGLGFRAISSGLRGGDGRRSTRYFHDGMARHRSLLLLLPDWKTGLVVAVNDYNAAEVFVEGVRDAFRQAAFAAEGQEIGYRRPLPRQVERSPEELQALAGDYSTLYGTYSLTVSGSALQVSDRGRRLVPLEDGSFLTLDAGGKPVSHPAVSDPVVQRFGALPGAEGYEAQTWAGDLVINLWRRLAPPSLPPGWESHAGTYQAADAAALERTGIQEVRLSMERGRLVVWLVRTPANAGNVPSDAPKRCFFVLQPESENRAQVLDSPFSGLHGYTLVFGSDEQGATLGLDDRTGVALYRRRD